MNKTELEERLVIITKEIMDLIFEHYLKLKDLAEEQILIRLKLEKGKYDNSI